MKNDTSTISAEEFDKIFDEGGDITPFLDMASIRRPGLEQRRVNVDLPTWIISSLDHEARKIGVTRQSIIKVWLSERIKKESTEQGAAANP